MPALRMRIVGGPWVPVRVEHAEVREEREVRSQGRKETVRAGGEMSMGFGKIRGCQLGLWHTQFISRFLDVEDNNLDTLRREQFYHVLPDPIASASDHDEFVCPVITVLGKVVEYFAIQPAVG